jgi:hypothetical protein|tara:strand:+ start:31 stop:399 length:369 start_codon:yes stop_codon:yes gene_type:complete
MTSGKDVIFGDDEIAEIETLGAMFSKAQLAEHFNIAPSTLNKVFERQPEVNAAYNRSLSMARSKAILTCYRKGVEDGDFNSLKLWLQHRADWRDRKEISGPEGGPVELDTDTVWTVNIVEGK